MLTMNIALQHQNKPYLFRLLDVATGLNTGIPLATAVTFEPIPNLKRWDIVTLLHGEQKLDLRIRRFKHTYMELCDLAHAVPRFAGFALSNTGDSSWHDLLGQYVAVRGADLKTLKYPAILLNNVSLPQVLNHLAATHNWHWHPEESHIQLGQVSSEAATELAIDTSWHTDEGLEVQVHGEAPHLGKSVKAGGTEGRTLSWRIHVEAGGSPVVTAVIGSPAERSPQPLAGTAYLPGTLQSLDPLVAEATVLHQARKVRIQLLDPQSQGGATRISQPRAVGDRVRVFWPLGIFEGLPEAEQKDVAAASEEFLFTTAEAAFNIKKWNVISDTIDFKIADVVDFHR